MIIEIFELFVKQNTILVSVNCLEELDNVLSLKTKSKMNWKRFLEVFHSKHRYFLCIQSLESIRSAHLLLDSLLNAHDHPQFLYFFRHWRFAHLFAISCSENIVISVS